MKASAPHPSPTAAFHSSPTAPNNASSSSPASSGGPTLNFNQEIYDMTVLFGEGGREETVEYLGKLVRTLCRRHIAAALELNEQR